MSLAQAGQIDEALAHYKKAQELDSNLEIPIDFWNTLCWYGSLNKQAEKVMFACEKAVELAPYNGGVMDSRGLARALTGDIEGAIEDFEAFIIWTDNEEGKAQRQDWIKSLKQGENPFTDEDIKIDCVDSPLI